MLRAVVLISVATSIGLF